MQHFRQTSLIFDFKWLKWEKSQHFSTSVSARFNNGNRELASHVLEHGESR